MRFEERPLECLEPHLMCAEESCDLDIEPDDIQASDTVTIVWEIQ